MEISEIIEAMKSRRNDPDQEYALRLLPLIAKMEIAIAALKSGDFIEAEDKANALDPIMELAIEIDRNGD